MAKTSNLLMNLIDRATGGQFDREAIQAIADELALNTIGLKIDGAEATIVNPNFIVVGKRDSVVALAMFRKQLLKTLANTPNKNNFFFVIHADGGEVDVGFDVSKIFDGVPEGMEHNFRYRMHVEGLGDFIESLPYSKTWFDELTMPSFASIESEATLSSVAFEILEAKATRLMILEG